MQVLQVVAGVPATDGELIRAFERIEAARGAKLPITVLLFNEIEKADPALWRWRRLVHVSV